jgi:hypothetical protein
MGMSDAFEAAAAIGDMGAPRPSAGQGANGAGVEPLG